MQPYHQISISVVYLQSILQERSGESDDGIVKNSNINCDSKEIRDRSFWRFTYIIWFASYVTRCQLLSLHVHSTYHDRRYIHLLVHSNPSKRFKTIRKLTCTTLILRYASSLSLSQDGSGINERKPGNQWQDKANEVWFNRALISLVTISIHGLSKR
jgi:hypothetical protein